MRLDRLIREGDQPCSIIDVASLNSRRCVLDSRFAERHYVGNDGVESTTSRTRCAVPGVRAARSAKSANRRLANLSHLPAERIEPISRSVQGEAFVPGAAKATVTRSLPHGDVADEGTRRWTGCAHAKTRSKPRWRGATSPRFEPVAD